MAIQENGRTTKKMEMDLTYTPMGKDMRVAGIRIKSKAMEVTNIRTEINTMGSGETITVMVTERCNTATMLPTKANGRKESSTVEGYSHLSKVIVITVNG